MTEYGHALRDRWCLQSDMRFLNHGSFGATPRVVLAAQDEWRARLEGQPVRFLMHELSAALAHARERLAAFLCADADGLVFVDNATTGVNAVLRGMTWRPGEVLVLGSHAYDAVRESAHYLVDRYAITIRVAEIPFPVTDEDAIVAAYRQVLASGARLAVLDHVTSPSALVLPIASLIKLCREHGTQVLIDGAHAPGMLDLDISSLGADWYVGNCHKWLFAPKGCAFLWTAPGLREHTHPLVISKHYGQGYLAEFAWTGTRDPSAWLSLDAALDFYQVMGGASLRQRNHDLLMEASTHIHQAWETTPPAPPEMLGSMATLALPEGLARQPRQAAGLHDDLWSAYRIELPSIVLGDRLWLRISTQAYNASDDYQALADAVLEMSETGWCG